MALTTRRCFQLTNNKTRDLIRIALFAALIAVSSYIIIPLPFSPVPVTAQAMFIMLAGSLLSVRHAAASLGVYLLLGIVGMPVFSGGRAGLGVLAGPTGGYLIGFFMGAVFIAWFVRGRKSFTYFLIANSLGGIVIVYLLGVSWLNFSTGMGYYAAFLNGALPFIIGDVFKVFAASVIAVRLAKSELFSGR